MNDPFRHIAAFQMTWAETWMGVARQALQVWSNALVEQQKFLNRAVEQHRTHVEIATGASFLDRYGRRSHDIDPERDV